jgi:hypothetical protein
VRVRERADLRAARGVAISDAFAAKMPCPMAEERGFIEQYLPLCWGQILSSANSPSKPKSIISGGSE